MNWKEFALQYLSFSRRERLAILVVVALILLVFIGPEFLAKGSRAKPGGMDTAWISSLQKLEQKQQEPGDRRYPDLDDNSPQYQYDRTKNNYEPAGKTELFYFDPNTLSPEGWKKLGLREKTIHTIRNYLSKGGHFKKPEDLQKIYGLFPDEFQRISPYIQIVAGPTSVMEFEPEKGEIKSFKANTPRYTIIDINTADTTAFIALPGIGSKLSTRIVSFREKLGGFYSITQLAEVYGLPDSTFQKIKQYLKLENPVLQKININTATVDELKIHPYIRFSIANPVVSYRKEHGPFEKLEDLKKVMAMTEDVFQKVAPYLTLQ